jgi:hypothetical protein
MGLGRLLERHRQRARRRSMRLCDGCHAAASRGELRQVDDRWLCNACASPPSEPAAPVLPVATVAAEDGRWWTPYAWLGVRLALYLLVLWLAHSSRILGMALRGALIGDVFGWGVERLAALRHTRLVALFEFFGYLAVVKLCYELPGSLDLPAAAEDRAVVGLTFMTVFGVRVIALVLRMRMESGEDDHLTW